MVGFFRDISMITINNTFNWNLFSLFYWDLLFDWPRDLSSPKTFLSNQRGVPIVTTIRILKTVLSPDKYFCI